MRRLEAKPPTVFSGFLHLPLQPGPGVGPVGLGGGLRDAEQFRHLRQGEASEVAELDQLGSARGGSFEAVQGIIGQRCQPCHSANPTWEGFSAPPMGITFDTPEQVQAQAARIEQMAVLTKTMPLGNVTGMTQQERDTLGAWIRAGAKID